MSNTKKSLASDEELERFEQFLFEMDDVLEEFVETASQAGFDLNHSAESLASASLERFIVTNREGPDSPKYMYFKFPVVTGYSTHPIEFCPIEMIANFKAKQEFGMLRTAVESHLKFKA